METLAPATLQPIQPNPLSKIFYDKAQEQKNLWIPDDLHYHAYLILAAIAGNSEAQKMLQPIVTVNTGSFELEFKDDVGSFPGYKIYQAVYHLYQQHCNAEIDSDIDLNNKKLYTAGLNVLKSRVEKEGDQKLLDKINRELLLVNPELKSEDAIKDFYGSTQQNIKLTREKERALGERPLLEFWREARELFKKYKQSPSGAAALGATLPAIAVLIFPIFLVHAAAVAIKRGFTKSQTDIDAEVKKTLDEAEVERRQYKIQKISVRYVEFFQPEEKASSPTTEATPLLGVDFRRERG